MTLVLKVNKIISGDLKVKSSNSSQTQLRFPYLKIQLDLIFPFEIKRDA